MIQRFFYGETKLVIWIGIVIFVSLFFTGGRIIWNQNMDKLSFYKEQRIRIELENEVALKLNKLKKIKENLKPISESSYFLSEVAKIVGKLNLKMVSILVLPIAKRKEFVKLFVNLELNSTYHELGAFISSLEKADFFINVDKLLISGERDNLKANTRVKALLVLSTFYLTDTVMEN
ncbi:MAG: hypothetical protein DRP78_00555 [Candidatus Omnitrophota bacterium]|nr:MAG: hypothetical protein DRP78_00555 [Candidatus Omnitrophota bacterium]